MYLCVCTCMYMCMCLYASVPTYIVLLKDLKNVQYETETKHKNLKSKCQRWQNYKQLKVDVKWKVKGSLKYSCIATFFLCKTINFKRELMFWYVFGLNLCKMGGSPQQVWIELNQGWHLISAFVLICYGTGIVNPREECNVSSFTDIWNLPADTSSQTLGSAVF